MREPDTATTMSLVVLAEPLDAAAGPGEIGCFASVNGETPLKTDPPPPRISLQIDPFREKVCKSSAHMSFCP